MRLCLGPKRCNIHLRRYRASIHSYQVYFIFIIENNNMETTSVDFVPQHSYTSEKLHFERQNNRIPIWAEPRPFNFNALWGSQNMRR